MRRFVYIWKHKFSLCGVSARKNFIWKNKADLNTFVEIGII